MKRRGFVRFGVVAIANRTSAASTEEAPLRSLLPDDTADALTGMMAP